MNDLEKKKFIFANFFLIANKLQVMGDAYLMDEEITTKQWFLILTISRFGERAPMLTEVANLMGSSRQNVKQLALKLEEKGFVKIEKDKADQRTLRLKLTQKNQGVWEKREAKDRDFILTLFKDLSQEEIHGIYEGFHKLLEEIHRMEGNRQDVGDRGLWERKKVGAIHENFEERENEKKEKI